MQVRYPCAHVEHIIGTQSLAGVHMAAVLEVKKVSFTHKRERCEIWHIVIAFGCTYRGTSLIKKRLPPRITIGPQA